MRSRRLGWWGLVLLGALGAVAGGRAVGGERPSPGAWAEMRCTRTIEREGLKYAESRSAKLLVCLRALTDGRMAPDFRRRLERGGVCDGLAAALGEDASRLRSRIVEACGAMPLDRLMGGLGFAAVMPGCTPDSTAAFVDCLFPHLLEPGGRLVPYLRPAACTLLAAAGLAAQFPEVRCEPDGGAAGRCPAPDAEGRYCGGPDAIACPAGLLCDRRDALCTSPDAGGVCARADTCVDDGQPVCGCDGQSYASDCARLRAGTALARRGACDPPPIACPFGNECPAGFFCEFPAGTCGEGQPGVCVAIRSDPCDLCSAFVDGPVCGCDAETYASDCARRAAGVAKFYVGTCF